MLSLHKLLEDLLLLPHHRGELDVHDPGVELAAHQGRALVVLDIPSIDGLRKLEVFAEALLLEVTHCKLVSKGEEMHNPISESMKCGLKNQTLSLT